MGPIVLFDKSTLQSLSLDESVWFDNFFISNICPLFYVETLADLEKKVRDGRTPEQEVRIIADKTPERHVYPNMFHKELCISNLQGYSVTMDGRPVIAGGKPVKTGGQSGLLYDPAPEVEAFSRWQKGEFLEVERKFAKNWRASIDKFDFESIEKGLHSLDIRPSKCKSLDDAKAIAESVTTGREHPINRMLFVFSLLDIPSDYFLNVYQRWGAQGCPSLSIFAPYAAYVLTIEIFFYIAVSSDLISSERVTNKIDLSYLFYLPFAMVFTSSDRLHKRCAPLFLREDQKFIWGPELKEDLSKLDHYFDQLPEAEKEKGLYAIASYPPANDGFLVTQLWDTFLPRWRKLTKKIVPDRKDSNDQIFKHITQFTEAKPLEQHEVDFDLSNPDAVVFQRKVKKKKGKWWQLPKDLQDGNTN